MRYTRFSSYFSSLAVLTLYSCMSTGTNYKDSGTILPVLNLIKLIGQERTKSISYLYKEKFAKDTVNDPLDFAVKNGLSHVHTDSGNLETELFKKNQEEEFSILLTRNHKVKGIIYSKFLTGGLTSNDKKIRETLEKSKFKLELINELSFPDHLPPRPIYVRGNLVCEYRIYMQGQMVYLQLYDNKCLDIYSPL